MNLQLENFDEIWIVNFSSPEKSRKKYRKSCSLRVNISTSASIFIIYTISTLGKRTFHSNQEIWRVIFVWFKFKSQNHSSLEKRFRSQNKLISLTPYVRGYQKKTWPRMIFCDVFQNTPLDSKNIFFVHSILLFR